MGVSKQARLSSPLGRVHERGCSGTAPGLQRSSCEMAWPRRATGEGCWGMEGSARQQSENLSSGTSCTTNFLCDSGRAPSLSGSQFLLLYNEEVGWDEGLWCPGWGTRIWNRAWLWDSLHILWPTRLFLSLSCGGRDHSVSVSHLWKVRMRQRATRSVMLGLRAQPGIPQWHSLRVTQHHK